MHQHLHARCNSLARSRAPVGSTFGIFTMHWSRLLTGAFVVAAVAAHAQSPAPLMAGGSATKLQYESAFTGYRPFAEAALLPWKRANSDAAPALKVLR